MSRRIQLFFTVILLGLAATGLLGASQSRGQARGAQPSAPQSAGPLGISQVIESLYSLGVTRTEELVARNKVQFEATPEVVGILKDLGATDKLLSFIPKPRPQPVAPPPVVDVPKIAGPFKVTCEPTDCYIVINDRYYGLTESHTRVVPTLPPGTATIQVFNNGYDPQTQKILLQEGRPAEARFQLNLTSEARLDKGQRFALDAMRAIGGFQAVALLQEFEGDGSLEWKDEKGMLQQGSMKFTKNRDQELQLEVKTKDGGSCTSLVSGNTSRDTCKGSLKNSEKVVSGAAANLLLYEVQNVIASFLSGTPTLDGTAAAQQIEFQRDDASWVLTLDQDKLPAELVHTRRGSAPSVINVRYFDYGKISSGKYPTHLQVSVDGNAIYTFTINGVSTRSVTVNRR
jgi:hypothetical protein